MFHAVIQLRRHTGGGAIGQLLHREAVKRHLRYAAAFIIGKKYFACRPTQLAIQQPDARKPIPVPVHFAQVHPGHFPGGKGKNPVIIAVPVVVAADDQSIVIQPQLRPVIPVILPNFPVQSGLYHRHPVNGQAAISRLICNVLSVRTFPHTVTAALRHIVAAFQPAVAPHLGFHHTGRLIVAKYRPNILGILGADNNGFPRCLGLGISPYCIIKDISHPAAAGQGRFHRRVAAIQPQQHHRDGLSILIVPPNDRDRHGAIRQ